MDEEDDLTPEEIDVLFGRTQPIGNAINALAQAELIVESAATSIPPEVRARLDAVIRTITEDTEGP